MILFWSIFIISICEDATNGNFQITFFLFSCKWIPSSERIHCDTIYRRILNWHFFNCWCILFKFGLRIKMEPSIHLYCIYAFFFFKLKTAKSYFNGCQASIFLIDRGKDNFIYMHLLSSIHTFIVVILIFAKNNYDKLKQAKNICVLNSFYWCRSIV